MRFGNSHRKHYGHVHVLAGPMVKGRDEISWPSPLHSLKLRELPGQND
jgi:hypothetical protein